MTKLLLSSLVCIALAVPASLRAADEKADKAADSKKAMPSVKADKGDDAKAKGRLPNGYAKIVDSTQRDKIYAIQAQYTSKIEDLQKQLQELTVKRDAEIRAVLTPEQQKQLDQAVGDTSKAKSSKKAAADTKSAGTDMKKS